MSECTRDEFVAKARETLGTKWVHQGRHGVHGLDCVGLLLWTLRQFDITHFEPPPYDRHAEWGRFIGFFRAHLQEIRLKDIRKGDVLVFRQHIFPCHCGIVTEDGSDPKFIHANATRRRVVEERYTPAWTKLTVSAFRVPGVN
jgi:cell wall-associated NlpC family hydrolase